jgi:hypothetical protein
MNYYLETKLIKNSSLYGKIELESSKLFDDSKDLGGTEEALFQNIIKKIKIYKKSANNKKYIDAIQLTYRNIETNEIKELDIRTKNSAYSVEDTEEFELKQGEFFTNFNISFPLGINHIYQIGFETNKKRKVLIGSELSKKIAAVNNIINNNGNEKFYNIILGTFGYYNKQLDSLGLYYVGLKEYLKKFYYGYFEMKRILKKDEKFRKKLEKNYDNFNQEEKFLFKTCLLPDKAFNEIIKFCMF